jgi:hypothetical protein
MKIENTLKHNFLSNMQIFNIEKILKDNNFKYKIKKNVKNVYDYNNNYKIEYCNFVIKTKITNKESYKNKKIAYDINKENILKILFDFLNDFDIKFNTKFKEVNKNLSANISTLKTTDYLIIPIHKSIIKSEILTDENLIKIFNKN